MLVDAVEHLGIGDLAGRSRRRRKRVDQQRAGVGEVHRSRADRRRRLVDCGTGRSA